jgi:tetratricopeptide (TPR) repeat protein
MDDSIFTIKNYKRFIKLAVACFLVLITAGNLLAQYKGAPVKKDRLIRVLRSKQLQTSDIVTIINRNGVDFSLTSETRRSLIAAGARPEIIQAISGNLRSSSKNDNSIAGATSNKNRKSKPAPTPDYDNLLEQAIYSYKEQRNPKNAVRILEAASKVNPGNPAAYQMLGFIYLYGLNDFAQAERSLRESFMKGGSAVFRVFHDDNGKFTKRCTGSLYISQNTLRFESDDNVHTFETSATNVDKIKLDTESTRTWKKHSIFKVFFKFGKEGAKFRFAPLTGAQEESKMVERFIASSDANKLVPDSDN